MQYRVRGIFLASHGEEIFEETSDINELGRVVQQVIGCGADMVLVIQYDD